MQVRQRGVAALDAKYLKKLADVKAENNALCDDVVADFRQLRIRQSVHSYVKQPSLPRQAAPTEWDYLPSKRMITMQKQLEGTQKYINEQCR